MKIRMCFLWCHLLARSGINVSGKALVIILPPLLVHSMLWQPPIFWGFSPYWTRHWSMVAVRRSYEGWWVARWSLCSRQVCCLVAASWRIIVCSLAHVSLSSWTWVWWLYEGYMLRLSCPSTLYLVFIALCLQLLLYSSGVLCCVRL